MNSSYAWADICTHLLKVCAHCQKTLLDPSGITCLFDVDSGKLPAAKNQALGEIVESLMQEICEVKPKKPGGRITVALHHRDETWMLAVRDQGIRKRDYNKPFHDDERLLHLASTLQGIFHTRAMPDGAVAAVAFVVKPEQIDAEYQLDHELTGKPIDPLMLN